MMETLHAIGSRGMGGAERFFVRLVRELSLAGVESGAIVRERSDLAELLRDDEVVLRTGMRNGLDLGTMIAIRRLVVSLQPGVIQTYLGRASRLTRVPRQSRTLHVARLGGYYRLGSYRHAHAWVGNTLGICDYLVAEGFPAERVFHITNFVAGPPEAAESRETTLSEMGVPANAMVVLGLGRFVAKKGFSDLLRALAGAVSEVNGRPVYLIVAGSGPLEGSLKLEADQLGIGERVIWPGWVADPSALFGAADLFVCPSRDEPLGNVILEAWSHGLPVISTRTAGGSELIDDGSDGLLVEPASPESLGVALDRLLKAESDRESLGRAGLATVRQRHGVEVVVDAYSELYSQADRLR